MKITKRQLRKVIREAVSLLVEYEQAVVLRGKDLVLVDDEGNESVIGDKFDAEEYGLYTSGESAPYTGGRRFTDYRDKRNYGSYNDRQYTGEFTRSRWNSHFG